jgi:ankyrin repeat protein
LQPLKALLSHSKYDSRREARLKVFMTREWEQAIHQGDLEQVRGLLGNGADVDSKDQYGQTALMMAAKKGYTDIVRLLVKSRAKLDAAAKYNLTALMLAVINGNTEIVRILVEAGANTTVRGTGAPGFWGKNALELAEDAGREEIASMLR